MYKGRVCIFSHISCLHTEHQHTIQVHGRRFVKYSTIITKNRKLSSATQAIAIQTIKVHENVGTNKLNIQKGEHKAKNKISISGFFPRASIVRYVRESI